MLDVILIIIFAPWVACAGIKIALDRNKRRRRR
jgi:hypothetical protein